MFWEFSGYQNIWWRYQVKFRKGNKLSSNFNSNLNFDEEKFNKYERLF